jgi:hypothetical protein
MPNTKRAAAAALAVAALCLAAPVAPVAAQGPNALTPAERGAGWRLLFDGTSLRGWRGLGRDTVPTAHWVVADGTIKKVANANVVKDSAGRPVRGGDLMTEATFRDFELAWEWRTTPGANSGVKYNVSEALSTGQPETALRPSTGARGASHSAIGFEYQVLDDDRHSDGKIVKHRTGDLYDLIEANAKKRVRPVGEWNESRIVLRGNHGEHWLNGEKVVEYELGSPAMAAAFAASKYNTMPWFVQRRAGHIVLQDHGDEVHFRRIRVRDLGAGSR